MDFGRLEKKTMRKYVCAILLPLLVCSFVSASPVTTLHWNGLTGNLGGYYINPSANGVGYGEIYPHGNWACEIAFDHVYNLEGYADGSELITFCIEWNEDLIGENNFTATVNTGAINGGYDGTGYDALNTESAWLYNEYLNGATFGISNLNRRAAVVQEAIWSFEGELQTDWSLYAETAGIKQSAINAVANGWTNDYIRVLNINWQSDGRKGQDVLCRIPEPMTIAILAMGGLLFRSKR